ncbi:MAG TPA: hypothetical protein VGA77_11760 [Propylenella sp.]
MSQVATQEFRAGSASGRLLLWSISPGRRPIARATATLRALLPLSRAQFERRLAHALEEAAQNANGFFLGGYSARRALGPRLLINIDPRRLKYRLKHRLPRNGRDIYFEDKFLGAGNWSPILQPVPTFATHREVEEIISYDFDYRRTAAYRNAMAKSGGRRPVKRNFVALKSPELVEGYFEYITELCRSIHANGVRRREEYRAPATAFRNPKVRLPWVELMESDVGLAIGPSGETYAFGCGKHRTAAALALRLNSIPVEVRLVHRAWLERQIARSKLPPLEALLRGIRDLDAQPRRSEGAVGPGARHHS